MFVKKTIVNTISELNINKNFEVWFNNNVSYLR